MSLSKKHILFLILENGGEKKKLMENRKAYYCHILWIMNNPKETMLIQLSSQSQVLILFVSLSNKGKKGFTNNFVQWQPDLKVGWKIYKRIENARDDKMWVNFTLKIEGRKVTFVK